MGLLSLRVPLSQTELPGDSPYTKISTLSAYALHIHITSPTLSDITNDFLSTAAGTSFVYSGGPFSDAGFLFVAVKARNPPASCWPQWASPV